MLLEKLEFFLLGFEVLKIGAGQDEVANQQPRPDEIGGVGSMIPKVLLADQIVNLPRCKLEDVGLMTVLGCLGMMLSEQFGRKSMNKTALGLVGEAEELVTCEVSGMGGGQIQKTSLLPGVTKLLQHVGVIPMWIEGRFGVHAVVDFHSAENHHLGE